MATSVYYQARITREKVWFFVATLRSFEHLAFDRTYSVETSTFEFFVTADLENYFLEFMHAMEQQGIVTDLVKLQHNL